MKRYFPVISGALALGTELGVFLSLMELPPFGKRGSDIVWALPFFGLVVVCLAIPGLMVAIRQNKDNHGGGTLAIAGLTTNGLSLGIPVLLSLFAIIRIFL